jgi:amidase
MVPMAHANDLGGSIRFPASCCGVFGFKPTRARNPLGPEYGDVGSGLAIEHAVTRSVRDSAALLDATSGPDLGDPYWAPPSARPFAAELAVPPGRLRIAFTTRTAEGQPADPECVTAARDAAAFCANLGHEVVEADLPELDGRVSAAIGTVLQGVAAWIVEYWVRKQGRLPGPDELEPYTRAYWQAGRRVSAASYLLALDDLRAFSRSVARFFTAVDIWLTPTLSEPPVPLGELTSSAAEPWRPAERMSRFVAYPAIVANITGAPAMSVPLHWNAAGLPIGVHFLGRFGDDATLFRLAAQLEQARPWAGHHPACGAPTAVAAAGDRVD